jgi:hypothetical protein
MLLVNDGDGRRRPSAAQRRYAVKDGLDDDVTSDFNAFMSCVGSVVLPPPSAG